MAQTTTRLSSSLTNVARAVWLAVVGLTVILFVSGVPISYAKASRLTTDLSVWLAQVGLPASFPPTALVSLDILSFTFSPPWRCSSSGGAPTIGWRCWSPCYSS